MSCSFLVCAVNNELPDLAKTYRGRFVASEQVIAQRGDIVSVQAADAKWGIRESLQEWLAAGNERRLFPGKFGVVRISDSGPGPEEIAPLIVVSATRRVERVALPPQANNDGLTDEGPAESNLDAEVEEVVYRHAWRLRLSDMTVEQSEAFQLNGEVELTQAEFEELCEHKLDRTFFDSAAAGGKGAVRADAANPLLVQEPFRAISADGRVGGKVKLGRLS